MTFLNDLKDGEDTEILFLEYLLGLDIIGWRNTSTTLQEKRLYDVVDKSGTTYELKTDRMWQRTGNIYVEEKTLKSSRADYIVYILKGDETFYVISRFGLLEILDYAKFKEVKGGDFKDKGYLIPIDDFKKLFNKGIYAN